MVVSFLSIFYFSNHFNFYFNAKILFVNSTSLLLIAIFKKYRETSSNHHCYCHFQDWDLYSYVQEEDSLASQDKEMVEFSEQPTSWKIILNK